MAALNVVILSSTFMPTIGGAESYALMLAQGLAQGGHTVTVLTDLPRDGHCALEERLPSGVLVRRASRYRALLAAPDKVPWEQLLFGVLSDLRAQLPAGSVDVVHANSQETAIWGAMLARSVGAPLICTFHEQAPEDEPLGTGRCEVVYSALPIAAVIAGSEFYLERALRFGADPDTTELIYHGIDTDRFGPGSAGAQARYGFAPDAPLVLCSARISPRKGQLELVEAFALVSEQVPEARLVLAGSCNSGSEQYRDRVLRRADELGVAQRLVLDGSLQHDDMPALYRSSSVVVQPSHAEGLGLALLEAMSCGRAVVGTRVSGITEIIDDGVTGRLVPLGDRAALSGAIVELLRNEELRARMAAAGHASVRERFSSESMIRKTERVYRDALTRRRAQRREAAPSTESHGNIELR